MNARRVGFRLSGLVLVFAVLFLGPGRRAWLVRDVTVSVGVHADEPVPCRVFYSDGEDRPFEGSDRRTVRPGGGPVEFRLPVGRLERFRVDFGNRPGRIRASRIRVSGRETLDLDWDDFSVRHGFGEFSVDPNGDLVATTTAPAIDPANWRNARAPASSPFPAAATASRCSRPSAPRRAT